MGAVLRRLGLGRLSALEPRLPAVRYERSAAGELLHVDGKKLGRIDGIGHRITGDRRGCRARGAGWEALHVAIDDASRLAYTARRSGPTSVVGPGSQARWPTSAARPAPASSPVPPPGSPAKVSGSSAS